MFSAALTVNFPGYPISRWIGCHHRDHQRAKAKLDLDFLLVKVRDVAFGIFQGTRYGELQGTDTLYVEYLADISKVPNAALATT